MEQKWSDKYAPKNASEYVFHDKTHKNIYDKIVHKGYMSQSLFLYGMKGTGKSSLATMIAEAAAPDSYKIHNCTKDGTKADAIAIHNETLISAYGTDPHRIIILNEFEKMTDAAQKSFKGIIEDCSEWCKFIIITNHAAKVNREVRSRLFDICFDNMPRDAFEERLVNILLSEGVQFTATDFNTVVGCDYPDLRKTIETFEGYTTIDNVLELP